jgi:hypothetical protein
LLDDYLVQQLKHPSLKMVLAYVLLVCFHRTGAYAHLAVADQQEDVAITGTRA